MIWRLVTDKHYYLHIVGWGYTGKIGAQYFFMVSTIKITIPYNNFYINVIYTVSVARITVHTVIFLVPS